MRGRCLRLVCGEKTCFEKEKQNPTVCEKPISVGLHGVRANLGSVVHIEGDCRAVWPFLRACVGPSNRNGGSHSP